MEGEERIEGPAVGEHHRLAPERVLAAHRSDLRQLGENGGASDIVGTVRAVGIGGESDVLPLEGAGPLDQFGRKGRSGGLAFGLHQHAHPGVERPQHDQEQPEDDHEGDDGLHDREAVVCPGVPAQVHSLCIGCGRPST